MQETEHTRLLETIRETGYAMLTGVFSESELVDLREQSGQAFRGEEESIRQRSGAVYAARNVLTHWPEARGIGRHPQLKSRLIAVLGEQCGLVRGLFFDKPPEQTWSLPWHKDLLIAVREGARHSPRYSPPRPRLGVPHTEPPVEVLENMLTARIHLDSMTAHNGPLEVQPGSHRSGKRLELGAEFRPVTLHCRAGDVLLMRPLLAHASGKSLPGCQEHRRILHLEFAAEPHLPEGVEWWEYYPLREATSVD